MIGTGILRRNPKGFIRGKREIKTQLDQPKKMNSLFHAVSRNQYPVSFHYPHNNILRFDINIIDLDHKDSWC
jgi:hypothetical protein